MGWDEEELGTVGPQLTMTLWELQFPSKHRHPHRQSKKDAGAVPTGISGVAISYIIGPGTGIWDQSVRFLL